MTTVRDRLRAERLDPWTMGLGFERTDLRGVGVIDMEPVVGLPRVDIGSPKIEAFSQCMPSHMPLWFEAERYYERPMRFATIVTPAEWVNFYDLESLQSTLRDPEDASYAVVGLILHSDGIIRAPSNASALRPGFAKKSHDEWGTDPSTSRGLYRGRP